MHILHGWHFFANILLMGQDRTSYTRQQMTRGTIKLSEMAKLGFAFEASAEPKPYVPYIRDRHRGRREREAAAAERQASHSRDDGMDIAAE